MLPWLEKITCSLLQTLKKVSTKVGKFQPQCTMGVRTVPQSNTHALAVCFLVEENKDLSNEYQPEKNKMCSNRPGSRRDGTCPIWTTVLTFYTVLKLSDFSLWHNAIDSVLAERVGEGGNGRQAGLGMGHCTHGSCLDLAGYKKALVSNTHSD